MEIPEGAKFHQCDVREAYELCRLIAQGVFGAVYQATSKSTQERVAIKIANKHTGWDRERLVRECRILQSLDHPNICSILETYEFDRYLAIVTKYYDGGNLLVNHLRSTNGDSSQLLSQRNLC